MVLAKKQLDSVTKLKNTSHAINLLFLCFTVQNTLSVVAERGSSWAISHGSHPNVVVPGDGLRRQDGALPRDPDEVEFSASLAGRSRDDFVLPRPSSHGVYQ